jgi:hypothetical protein
MAFVARVALLLALCVLIPPPAFVDHSTPTVKAVTNSWFWGDEDCSGAINALDTLTFLFQRRDGEPNLPANCPLPGQSVFRGDNDEEVWSDLNCTANFELEEALFPLRYLLFGFTGPGGTCPAVGELVYESQN